jgi:hypothetical protein
MNDNVINTRLFVACFWDWYEAASPEARSAFAYAPDFGRPQHVDAPSWTVVGPEAGTPGV